MRGRSREEIKRAILAGADVNELDRRTGETLLMWYASFGERNMMRFLIEAKADVSIHTANGIDAIWWTLTQQDLPCTKLLLQAGASYRPYLHDYLNSGGFARRLQRRASGCRRAAEVFLSGHFKAHKDVVKLIALVIWSTRYDDSWE